MGSEVMDQIKALARPPQDPQSIGDSPEARHYRDIHNLNADGTPLSQAAMNDKNGLNVDGSPRAPTYNFYNDPNTGVLNSQFQNQYGSDITPDTTAINALQNNAISTGPSSWAQAQNAQADLQNQGLMQSAQQQNAASNAQAQGDLGSHYGLSQAAQERLATQNQRSNQMALQNVGFQGAQTKAGIAAQDAASKQSMLSALPGQQNALAASQMANRQASLGQQNFNTTSSLNQNALQNASKLENYKQQMGAWGAGKNADAMQAQSSGGKK